MTREPITVLLVDDHAAIRAGLRFILETAPDIRVVGEAADGAGAITNAAALHPDVVLMDIRMPGIDGVDATRHITTHGNARVLILTTFDVDDYVFSALRAGAAGFLLKTVEPAALLDAVRRVADGDAALAPEVTRKVLDAFVLLDAEHGNRRAAVPPVGAGYGLTERELDVLGLVADGFSNRAISAELRISGGTTKTHVSRVLTKLGCATRTQAAILAREERLVIGREQP
jgi:DNA-binding NarL/FixJ family response regulator